MWQSKNPMLKRIRPAWTLQNLSSILIYSPTVIYFAEWIDPLETQFLAIVAFISHWNTEGVCLSWGSLLFFILEGGLQYFSVSTVSCFCEPLYTYACVCCSRARALCARQLSSAVCWCAALYRCCTRLPRCWRLRKWITVAQTASSFAYSLTKSTPFLSGSSTVWSPISSGWCQATR